MIESHNTCQLAWKLAPDSLLGLDVDVAPAPTLYGACLLIDGESAIISTADRGVLRWKLGTDQACRFAIDD